MEEKLDTFIYGRHVLDVLLGSEGIPPEKVYIQNSSRGEIIEQIIQRCKEKKIPFNFVPKEKLSSLVRGAHQGVAAKLAVQNYREFEYLAKKTLNSEFPVICVIDELHDPHNLGAIIRSAAAFGIGGIVIPKHRSAGLTGAVMKSSAGAMNYMEVARVVNIAQSIRQLKELGYWIYGSDMNGQDISKAEFSFPAAVVVGGEHSGIRRLVKENCDLIVSIPQKAGKVESLNASVAAGIIFYKIYSSKINKPLC